MVEWYPLPPVAREPEVRFPVKSRRIFRYWIKSIEWSGKYKLEQLGVDPWTFQKLSERSTNWATSTLNRGPIFYWNTLYSLLLPFLLGSFLSRFLSSSLSLSGHLSFWIRTCRLSLLLSFLLLEFLSFLLPFWGLSGRWPSCRWTRPSFHRSITFLSGFALFRNSIYRVLWVLIRTIVLYQVFLAVVMFYWVLPGFFAFYWYLLFFFCVLLVFSGS